MRNIETLGVELCSSQLNLIMAINKRYRDTTSEAEIKSALIQLIRNIETLGVELCSSQLNPINEKYRDTGSGASRQLQLIRDIETPGVKLCSSQLNPIMAITKRYRDTGSEAVFKSA